MWEETEATYRDRMGAGGGGKVDSTHLDVRGRNEGEMLLLDKSNSNAMGSSKDFTRFIGRNKGAEAIERTTEGIGKLESGWGGQQGFDPVNRVKTKERTRGGWVNEGEPVKES
jgi:hypothetical protein